MTYSYGTPHNPQPDDERFDTQEAAELAALNQPHEGVVAVWDDVTGEVLALVWEGAVYRA
jgi:hypothetical protein